MGEAKPSLFDIRYVRPYWTLPRIQKYVNSNGHAVIWSIKIKHVLEVRSWFHKVVYILYLILKWRGKCTIPIHICRQNGYSTNKSTHKPSNHFGKAPKTTNARITHTHTFRFCYAQYMGSHHKSIFWWITHPNPNCTFCPNNAIDTWPRLLSTCSSPHIKGLCIDRHNKAVHHIVHTFQSNQHIISYTLVNARNQTLSTPWHHIPKLTTTMFMHYPPMYMPS